MTDMQLYFATGVPSVMALLSIAVNVALYVHLSSRMETRLADLRADMNRSLADLRADMNRSLADLRADMNRRLDEIVVRLGRIETGVKEHSEKIAALEERTSPLGRR